MTNANDAPLPMADAQELLEQVEADNEKLAELVGWLGAAVGRADQLGLYVGDQAMSQLGEAYGEDPAVVIPLVADEDRAWEVLVDHNDHLLRLLRVVTGALTASLNGNPDDEF